jgi:hypothetical protein
MAERPELRNIANSNGGSAMRLSDSLRANSPEGVFVASGAANSVETGLPPANAATGRDVGRNAGARGRLQPTDGRAARLAAMSARDREIFNLWARRVGALYSLIIVALVTAMLLGSHSAAEQKAVATAPAATHASSVASAPDLGTGK